MDWQGVGMDQRGKCILGWGFDLRHGMDREGGLDLLLGGTRGWFLGVMALRQSLDGMKG